MRRRIRSAVLLCLVPIALAGCASSGSGGSVTIRGELAVRERIALPSEAYAVVELSRTQDGRVITEQQIPLNGNQLPVRFELRVQRSFLAPDAAYALRGAVHVLGRPEWVAAPVEIKPASGTVDVGTLLLRPWGAISLAARPLSPAEDDR